MQSPRRKETYVFPRRKIGYPIGPAYEVLLDSLGNPVEQSNGELIYVLTATAQTLGLESSIGGAGYIIPKRDFGYPAIAQAPPHYAEKLDPDGHVEYDPSGNTIWVPI